MRPATSRRSRFEEFVATHGAGLGRLAYGICGDRERAEDAVQEALTRVYQRWSKITDPLAYARRATVNATRDDWRRAVRVDRAYRAAAQLPTNDPADDPHERFLDNRALMDALDDLPHGQRTVIVLRYGSQLSESETAAILDISTGTVKSQSARALARLREALSDDEPADRELELA